MNLTSKRMFQFALLCAGVCVMNATAATQYMADSFENNPGDWKPATNGMPIVWYKSADDNGFGVPMTTNWLTAAGDASKIVTADAGNQAYMASPRPMAGMAVSNLVLNLETEGQTLTRAASGIPAFTDTAPVYVDTLIKFTPSEDTPTIADTSVKAAVFVNVSSNLCVYHGVGGAGSNPVSTPTTVAINPEQWYRLTIKLSYMPEAELDKVFQIYLDGTLITDDDAMDDAYAPGGSFFYSASNQGTLTAVAFQGTGMVDELVIADDVTLAFNSATLLTLAFDESKIGVTLDGSPVSSNGTVEADSTIVIDASDWYEIASVTGTGDAAYAGLPAPGALVNVSTGTVSATAAETLTITVQPFSGSTAISTGLGGSYPANKVAAWALANGLGAGDLTGAMLDDYLLNKAPATNAELEIKAIVVDPDTQIATVTVGTIAGNVAFSSINGTVKVQTRDALSSGDWSSSITVPVTVNSPNTTVDVEVDLSSAGASYFVKAVVE
jgi:hypothetical protein